MLTVSQFDLLQFKQLLILKNVEVHVCGGFSSPGVAAGNGNPSSGKPGPFQIRLKQKLASEKNLNTHEDRFPLMCSNLY